MIAEGSQHLLAMFLYQIKSELICVLCLQGILESCASGNFAFSVSWTKLVELILRECKEE